MLKDINSGMDLLSLCAKTIHGENVYGDDATWAAIQERHIGNCKNFAAGEKAWLFEQGWNVSAALIAIMRVEPAARAVDSRGLEILHAILICRLPDAKLRVIDQRFPGRVLSLAELMRIGYEGVEIQDPDSPTGWSYFSLVEEA